jgi:Flp pilus assembly protein TadG
MSMVKRSERGATAVEFALIAPLVLFLIGALLALGFYGVFNAIVQNAVREAARFAAVPVDPYADLYPSEDAVRAHLVAEAPSVMGSPSSFALRRTGGSSPGNGDIVTVTVTYRTPVLSSIKGLLQGAGLGGLIEISRSASARME